MTGTHPYNVGLDYLKMISNSENDAIQVSRGGVLGKDIDYMAKTHGIEMNNVIQCEMDAY